MTAKKTFFIPCVLSYQNPTFAKIILSHIRWVDAHTLSWVIVQSLKSQIRSGALKLSYDYLEQE